MLREYEFTLIARPELQEDGVKKIQEKYESLLLQGGGQILKKDIWGTRKLAFPIKKTYKGHYTLYDLIADPKNLVEAERLLRIDENVLRYMTVCLGEDVDVEKRKEELNKKPVPVRSDDDDDRD